MWVPGLGVGFQVPELYSILGPTRFLCKCSGHNVSTILGIWPLR